VVLEVIDDGCGMGEEVRRRAFEPFYTTRRGQGGTGLGLHIVWQLVTRTLGGRIDIDGEPGVGTHFRIVLPRFAPAAQESAGA
jgi:signal transduction histidine kinase